MILKYQKDNDKDQGGLSFQKKKNLIESHCKQS